MKANSLCFLNQESQEELQIGGQGIIYKVNYYKQQETTVVIKKCLDAYNFNHLKNLQNEANILSNLKHRNIIMLLDQQFVNGQEAFIVEQFAEKGDLYIYYSKHAFWKKESICRTLFHQLIDGISYCHSKSIAHLDIKLENLLLDKNFTLKIVDFGFAVNYNVNEFLDNFRGTQGYVAPEILKKKPYKGQSADLFACGVVLFNMLIGCQPFNNATKDDEFYKFIFANDLKEFWAIFNHMFIPKEFQDLINGLFACKPKVRFTIKDIINSKWYQGNILQPDELIEEMSQICARKKIQFP